jgi:hypothetical protein
MEHTVHAKNLDHGKRSFKGVEQVAMEDARKSLLNRHSIYLKSLLLPCHYYSSSVFTEYQNAIKEGGCIGMSLVKAIICRCAITLEAFTPKSLIDRVCTFTIVAEI